MKNDRKYSAWQWVRAYLVLALLLPFYPLMALASGRTLPNWITQKLVRWHVRYTESHPMDFRIPPDESIPSYMDRWWYIPRNWAFNVYLHIVRRSDDDRALHCHPWPNFSIVLTGGYYEHQIKEGGIHTRTWCGPGSMKFRWHGRKAHRLELPIGKNIGEEWVTERPARTTFITGPVLRRWGFHHPTGWVDAYDWDDFCEKNNLKFMPMGGGSDSVTSARNKITKDQ